jgi:NAD(P)-dependent dehydrogenase (short-subunit alcohol dehydrogenase family)
MPTLEGRMLDGKVAIVTGSGNGVGRGEAIMLADHGAKVIVNDVGGSVSGDTDGDKRAADSVVEVIAARGGEAVANYDSVADFDGARNIIDTAIDAFGRLDVLVNNAGVLRDRMMFSMPPEDFDAVVKVHLYGTWNTMHHASAYWRNESKEGRQPRASIVNTVSSAGLQGQASQINYGAAKAGIAAMTVIASLELKRYGVRANCVGPGGFTRMVAQAMKDIEVKNPEDYTEFDPMNPGNSAPAVVYLASDESLHVTGQVLRLVGNNLCVYRPWEMGEQFFATEQDGSPKQWDPVDIGRILNRYHFMSENPGIDAQKRR